MITLRIGWQRRMKNLILNRKDLRNLCLSILLKVFKGGLQQEFELAKKYKLGKWVGSKNRKMTI